MKRTIIYSGTIMLFTLFVVACDEQNNRTGTDDMADLREEMNEVIQTIDEAVATNDISEFKNKTDNAISSLDNKIDDYLDEMDNAERRIDGNARNRIIDVKQKKVEVEFKLALLDQDDYDWDNNENRGNRIGTTTDTNTRTGTDANNMPDADNRTGTNQISTNRTPGADDGTGANVPGTNNNRTTGTDNLTQDNEHVDTEAGRAATRDINQTNRNRLEIKYGPELVNDLKSDLRDLRSKVDQLAQTLPGSYDDDNRKSSM